MINRYHNPRRGFTLTELLVVIVVIVLLFTVALPNLNQLLSSGNAEVARNALSVAVSHARSRAGMTPSFLGGKSYQGSAILVTNANEMRILINTDKDEENKQVVWSSGNDEPDRHAYRDAPDTSYVKLPSSLGLMGIRRGGTTSGGGGLTYYMAPPFTIRFNTEGNLITRNTNNEDFVYYDANYNNTYDTSSRGNAFAPQTYDPIASDYDPSNWHSGTTRYIVSDFEEIETAIGVLVYNKHDFWAEGYTLEEQYDDQSTGAGQWLKNNGTVILFNRYSGASIRP